MDIKLDVVVRLAVPKDVRDRKDQERAGQLCIPRLQRRHDPDPHKEPYRLNRP